MKIPREISREWALASLRSTVCPHCERPKGRMKSLCTDAFFALPKPMQRALYLQIGHGYESALRDALDWLNSPEALVAKFPRSPITNPAEIDGAMP